MALALPEIFYVLVDYRGLRRGFGAWFPWLDLAGLASHGLWIFVFSFLGARRPAMSGLNSLALWLCFAGLIALAAFGRGPRAPKSIPWELFVSQAFFSREIRLWHALARLFSLELRSEMGPSQRGRFRKRSGSKPKSSPSSWSPRRFSGSAARAGRSGFSARSSQRFWLGQ